MLEVGEIIAITEYFVVTGAPNARQVQTIVEEIERRIKEESGESPRSIEGLADATWVLLDYGDVVVHVFLGEAREYYDLERLWADAPRVDWSHAPRSRRRHRREPEPWRSADEDGRGGDAVRGEAVLDLAHSEVPFEAR